MSCELSGTAKFCNFAPQKIFQMKAAYIRQRLKPWILPLAMLFGALFHSAIDAMQWMVPYLIFVMLFITFCRVKPSELRPSGMIWSLLAVQLIGSAVLFFALRPIGLPLAQAAFICVLCPTATAAPVVTGMLGGSIAKVATYSIASNLVVALTAPFLFILAGAADTGQTFFEEFSAIALHVAPLILLPLISAFILYYVWRPAHDAVDRCQGVSFYIWAVSLLLVVGKSVSFVLSEPADAIPEMIAIALLSALLCILQFVAGRRIGARYGDRISAAQGLGQKNTVLAIWPTLPYLNPIASIGPAAYVLWQNSINSAQLYYKMKKTTQAR